MDRKRVAVVGGCASGKSSIVAALCDRGLDAWVVAQEHSEIADLWRHQDPDALVLLEASLAVVRARRDDPRWPRWIYDLQRRRLADARAHADLIVRTDHREATDVADEIVVRLRGARDDGEPASQA